MTMRRRIDPSRLAIPMLLGTVALASWTAAAWSQPSHRPARKSQPVPITRTAPDTTATIPEDRNSSSQAKTVAPLMPLYPTKDFGESVPTPFDLPIAPRAKMRACGAKWQAIKLAGDAKSDTWRDFATKCLSEPIDTKVTP